MIVAHPVQKRRVARDALRLCGSVRRDGEKQTSCPPVDRQVLLINDCLAWLVPRSRASCAPELEQVPKKLAPHFR